MDQSSLPGFSRAGALGPAVPAVSGAAEGAFGAWVRAVARDLRAELRFHVSDRDKVDEAANVAFLIGPLALEPLGATGLPAFYAGSHRPLTAGVRLIGALYEHAHDPGSARGLSHRIGFGHAPSACVVDRFFAIGLDGRDGVDGAPALAYRAEAIDMHHLGCASPEDLRGVYAAVLSSRLPQRTQKS